MKFNKLVCLLFLLLSVSCIAQINTNIDDSTGWLVCVEPTCNPGGNQVGPTSYNVVNKTATSKDGQSLYVSVTGPEGVNFLTYKNTGVTSANYFMLDLWVYVTAAAQTNTQVLEYDAWVYTAPYRWMFGTQCVKNGDWWGWNDLTGTWIDARIPCNITTGKWHHIQQWSHRDFTNNCSGMPCSYQDTLGIDNIYHNWNIVTPASLLPAGWGNNSGVNLQVGLDGTGGTAWEWVDELNFTELGQ
jgi:hypothetical protein